MQGYGFPVFGFLLFLGGTHPDAPFEGALSCEALMSGEGRAAARQKVQVVIATNMVLKNFILVNRFVKEDLARNSEFGDDRID
jgi:hypothetical protein